MPCLANPKTADPAAPSTMATSGPGTLGATRESSSSRARIVTPTASVGAWVSPSFEKNLQSRRKTPAGSNRNPNRVPSWPAMIEIAMPLM